MRRSNQCRLLVVLTLVSLVIGIGRQAAGERFYNQPYLGLKSGVDFVEGPLAGYRAENIVRDVSQNLGSLAAQSDLIFIGINGEPKEIKLPGKQTVQCEAKVRLYDIIKAKRAHHRSIKFLRLQWEASATGIGASQRHLFFVKEEVDGDGNNTYRVLRAAYMTPDSRNRIRLVDYSDRIFTDFALEILHIRESALVPRGFEKRLVKTLAGEPQQMLLLTALPVDLARPGWRQALRSHGVYDTTRLHRFAVLANDVITRGNDEDLLALLRRVQGGSRYAYYGGKKISNPHYPFYRMAEFLVYDLFRHYGNDRLVRLLIKHGNTCTKKKKGQLEVDPHPTALVSVAFALAEIGGKEARQAIERWSRDKTLTGKTVRISGEFPSSVEVKYGELFSKALKRLEENNTIEDDPKK